MPKIPGFQTFREFSAYFARTLPRNQRHFSGTLASFLRPGFLAAATPRRAMKSCSQLIRHFRKFQSVSSQFIPCYYITLNTVCICQMHVNRNVRARAYIQRIFIFNFSHSAVRFNGKRPNSEHMYRSFYFTVSRNISSPCCRMHGAIGRDISSLEFRRAMLWTKYLFYLYH